jgi:Spy/CpxP family protein refolding chaperone
MKKKALLVLSLMLAVALIAGSAQAFGPRGGQGPGPMGGPGPAPRQLNPDDPFFKFYQDTASLRGELVKKHIELQALLAVPKVDEAKVQALYKETQKLENELSNKRLEATLEMKKRNPDWQPGGYGSQGWGYGMGRAGQWRGGPGPWQ